MSPSFWRTIGLLLCGGLLLEALLLAWLALGPRFRQRHQSTQERDEDV